METKKEGTERKEKAGILNEKLRELSEEELEQVTGGMRELFTARSEMLESVNKHVINDNIANTNVHGDKKGQVEMHDMVGMALFGK